MPCYICTTCGTQFADTNRIPERCPICEDERQYVNPRGQQWTTLEKLRETHRNEIKPQGDLTGIGTEPRFGIGQRALLLRAPGGNILWDCISLLDAATEEQVRAMGGLAAIAISHPHYYTCMVEWSRAFDGVPIYLHADDREWVMRPDPAIVFWEGDTRPLSESVTLIRCGGHFAGATVLHWAGDGQGKGALLTGDTIQVVPDCRYVSFMYSFPNLIPLGAAAVERIGAAVENFAYNRIYGAWWDAVVMDDGKAAVARSVERYVRAIRK